MSQSSQHCGVYHLLVTLAGFPLWITGLLFIMIVGLLLPLTARAVVEQQPRVTQHGWRYSSSSEGVIARQPLDRLGLKEKQAREQFRTAYTYYKQNEYVLARRLLLQLAQDGSRDAQYLLGIICDSEEDQLPAERRSWRSFIWYHAAARQGHADAQHNLAMAYARGEGVEQNMERAMYWWQQAAWQGNTDSQYNLGIVYALGMQVSQDFQRARMWWQQAAINGDAAAQYNLGALYASQASPFHNDCKALHWLSQSQKNGFQQANQALMALDSKGLHGGSCK